MKTKLQFLTLIIVLILNTVLSQKIVAAQSTNIYVANFGNSTVGEYTSTGGSVNTNLISSSPTGIAIYNNNIYISSGNTIG